MPFWIIAALAALATLLWLGGWRTRAELAQTGAWKLALPAAVPALAFGVYFLVGQPFASTAARDLPRHDAGDLTRLAEGLAARLAANPDDPQGWELLASTYEYLGRDAEAQEARARAATPAPGEAPARMTAETDDAGAWAARGRAAQSARRFADAAQAFARATALRPDDAALWADRADAEAAAGGKGLAPVAAMIDTALRLNPDEPKTLWLAGTLALELGDTARALKHWRHMERLLPGDDPRLGIIRANIAELAPPAAKAAPAAAGATTIRGTVSLAPGLAAKVRPGDTVFVIVRATDGSPMPLAVWRATAAQTFPLQFTLDDRHQLTPERPLEQQAQVLISARISRSGSARAESGDLEAAPRALKPAAGGALNLVVDRTV